MIEKQLVEDVKTWIDEQRTWFVEYASALVETESPTGDCAAQHRVLDLLQPEFERLGYACERLEHQQAPLLRTLTEPGACWLVGHCDTVWKHGSKVDMPILLNNSILSGPGVFDMKGGLAIMVLALRAIRELNLKPAIPLGVLINSDEEIGSPHSRERLVESTKDAACAFVFEPAMGPEGALKIARRGMMRYTLRVRGKAAHSGLDPDKGISAIHALAGLVTKIVQLAQPESGLHVNVGRIEGGTAANVIAPHAHAEIDIRCSTARQMEHISGRIEDLLHESMPQRCLLEQTVAVPPMVETAGQSRILSRIQEISQALGIRHTTAISGGASDANTISQYTPTIDGMGAVGASAHAEDEHIDIDQSGQRAALLALTLVSDLGAKAYHRNHNP